MDPHPPTAPVFAPVPPTPVPPAQPATQQDRWPLHKRIAFRFVAAYAVLYLLPFPLSSIPGLSFLPPVVREVAYWPTMGWHELWRWLVPWVAEHVLHLKEKITIFPGGSGDTTFNYVQVLCFAVLAAVIAALWTGLDEWRGLRRYTRTENWVRVYVRFGLALVMLGYGMAKVVKLVDPMASQFPAPRLDKLVQPYGEASPMGILWTFMGSSTGYTAFAGIMEVIGGLLLIPRRTATLGGLFSAAVMFNVFMMNMCYDVPVKLYSAHLMLFALFVALPDMPKLAALLVLRRQTAPGPERRLFSRRALDLAARIVGSVYILAMVAETSWGQWNMLSMYGSRAPKPALRGLYEVEEQSLTGEVLPPLITDERRWRWVIIDSGWGGDGIARIIPMRGAGSYFKLKEDLAAGTIVLSSMGGDPKSASLTFARPDDSHVTLEGTYLGTPLTAKLKLVKRESFLLVNRGFNWINEFPYNR